MPERNLPRILVIDDSEVIRHLLRDYLTDLGYEVELAVDGRQGVTQALEGNFTLVFCDIHMPGKNGHQVYREVSAQKPGMIFIMTDSLPGELAELARRAGAEHCLTKPFDLKQVSDLLQELLSPTGSKK